jgi:serine/threonine-protein kinase
MVERSWSTGRVLADKYRLESPLGEGGMGAVWRAEHLTLRSPVAVKLIDEKIVDNKEALNRFMREAQAAAALRSSHVVQILDYGVQDRTPYMVMELLEGENLAERLERVGRLSAAETLRVITHVGRAIGRAHEAGIVHRDLKPENIFIIRESDSEITKVLDFGIAKVEKSKFGLVSGMGTRSGSLIGTPFYMSPEQAEGDREVDWRTDLWAIGVIAFECLTGTRPFESQGLGNLLLQICSKPLPIPTEHGPVPAGFDAWFARALTRDPKGRFQSARELVDGLRDCLLSGATRDALASSAGFELDELVAASPIIHQRPAKAGTPQPSPSGVSTISIRRTRQTAAAQRFPSARQLIWTLGALGVLLVALVVYLALNDTPPTAAIVTLPAAQAPAEPGPAPSTAPDPAPAAQAAKKADSDLEVAKWEELPPRDTKRPKPGTAPRGGTDAPPSTPKPAPAQKAPRDPLPVRKVDLGI